MQASSFYIKVDILNQRLQLFNEADEALMDTAVSTAAKGAGERLGSEQTPRGRHTIRAKIGQGEPVNTVFVHRRPTGEIYTPALRHDFPARDWILTRILWLSGLEPGKNRLGNNDTMRRYVYLHGAPDDDEMGVPSSHGCIKMRNSDIIKLFDIVPVGTPVNING